MNSQEEQISAAGVRFPGRVVLGLILWLFSLASLYVFLHSPVFAVQEVDVEGIHSVSAAEVKRLSGIVPGSNIFVVNEKAVKERLLLHPLIKEARLERDLPHRVVLRVQERVPLVLVPVEGGFVGIDEDGCCLLRVGSLAEINLPVVTGFELPGGGVLGEPAGVKILEEVLGAVKQFSPVLMKEIAEINAAQPEELRIYTLSRVEIKVGSVAHLRENLPLLEQIVACELKKLGEQPLEYVDMSFKGPPVVKFKGPVRGGQK